MLRSVLTLSLLLLAACADTSGPGIPAQSASVIVRSGTSFGHCLGYCTTEMTILPEEIVFVRSSRDPARYPTRTERLPITRRERDEVVALANTRTFFNLQEVHGCPDCADGGAEWIEVEGAGERKRVTFEHGESIRGIEPLIAKLRAYRARFQQEG